MKTTLDIPDDLLARLRERAARDGRDVQEVAARLLAAALDDAATSQGATPAGAAPAVEKNLPTIKARPVESGADTSLAAPVISTDPVTGLPVIRGAPDAPISRMSAEEIQAIIDQAQLEEDLERLGIPPRR